MLGFRVADRDDSKVSIPVRYSGEVPDPFADGREVIVSGKVDDGTFVAQRDSLITKCPSKYATEAKQDPQHVIISQVITLGAAACVLALLVAVYGVVAALAGTRGRAPLHRLGSPGRRTRSPLC